jgi:hypothetical protein
MSHIECEESCRSDFTECLDYCRTRFGYCLEDCLASADDPSSRSALAVCIKECNADLEKCKATCDSDLEICTDLCRRALTDKQSLRAPACP